MKQEVRGLLKLAKELLAAGRPNKYKGYTVYISASLYRSDDISVEVDLGPHSDWPDERELKKAQKAAEKLIESRLDELKEDGWAWRQLEPWSDAGRYVSKEYVVKNGYEEREMGEKNVEYLETGKW
jgi:hypothetical protein